MYPIQKVTVINRSVSLTVLLHHAEELDNDLGGRSKEDLSLTSLLGVDDGLKAVSQNTHENHLRSISVESGFRDLKTPCCPYLLSNSKDNNN